MMHILAVLFLVLLVLSLMAAFPDSTVSFWSNMAARLWGGHNRVDVVFHKGSAFCNTLLKKCPILREKYNPPLWGYFGHVQTFWFGFKDVFFSPPPVHSTRYYVHVQDGSTVLYDVFEPKSRTRDEVVVVVPGISNSSQTDYIQNLCSQVMDHGYRAAVLNHMGALKDCELTGHRIFTYGGTGDLTLMFDDLVNRNHPDTKYMCVGISMGGLLLMKLLGEQPKHHKRVTCAMSINQGYSSLEATKLGLAQWQEMRSLYYSTMVKRLIQLLNRHKQQLFTKHPIIGAKGSNCTSNGSIDVTSNGNAAVPADINPVPVPVVSGDRDCNGFAIDNSKISIPDERMWTTTSWKHLDEYYTRRVMGFKSHDELVEWVSCIDHLYRISNLPVMFVNAYDDPIIPHQLTRIPIKYTAFNHNAMFVGTQHGGHCGFFEGGWFIPTSTTWINRLILQFFAACTGENKET